MSEEQIEVQEEVSPVEAVEAAEQVVEKEKPSGFIDFQELPEGVRDNVKMRVDSDFRKNKELERKAAEYQKKAEEYEKQLAELNKPKEVAAPSTDDWYSDPDRAQAQLAEHSSYIQSQAQYDAQQKQAQQAAEAEQAKQGQERLDVFVKRGESAGITQFELETAATVAARGLTEDTATHLLSHEYGPQILVHLAKAPMEMQELASLNPYQVGVKLENIAKSFKPTKVSKTPPPDDPISGSGVSSEDEYGGLLKGSQIR